MWPCYTKDNFEVSMSQEVYSKAPLYMTEPKLATNIDTTMNTLTSADSLNIVKEKFEAWVVTDRLKLGELVLNYKEYKGLRPEEWRLKLLKDEAPQVEAPHGTLRGTSCSMGLVIPG
jgi:hypothetical protein